MVAKMHDDLKCKQRAPSTCSWGWQAHLLSACCVSETSSLIFHHYCEGAARGIPFTYKTDHIISLHKTLQGLPSYLVVKAKILTMTYEIPHDLPFPSASSLPTAHSTPATRPPHCSMDVTRTHSPLSLCSCYSLCLEFSSSKTVVLYWGMTSPSRGIQH